MEHSDPKNTAATKPKRTPPSRAGKGPTPASWTSGRSGNPAGRPKGFAGVARLIADSTRDCAELVEWALAVWRDPKRPHAERAAAHQWLSDRALGRPMASAELTVHATSGAAAERDYSRLTDEQIEAELQRLDALALAPGGSDPEAA